MANIPDFVINSARAEIEAAKKEFELAKSRIDPRYYDFLVLLEQHVKISSQVYDLTQEARRLGIWTAKDRGTYVTVSKPYVTVDGRIKMARDEHAAKGAKLNISAPFIQQVGETTLLSVTVDSELHGQAVGTIEVGEGGRGVDQYNPFANAQTSAIGRALGFLGYGLVGTGVVATAEEIRSSGLIQNPQPETQTQTQANESSSKEPSVFRVLTQAAPEFSRDGSCTVNVMLESREIVKLLLPKAMKNFAAQLGANMVLNVKGWLNNKRLRVAELPKVEDLRAS